MDHQRPSQIQSKTFRQFMMCRWPNLHPLGISDSEATSQPTFCCTTWPTFCCDTRAVKSFLVAEFYSQSWSWIQTTTQNQWLGEQLPITIIVEPFLKQWLWTTTSGMISYRSLCYLSAWCNEQPHREAVHELLSLATRTIYLDQGHHRV